MIKLNFYDKISKVKSLLKNWSRRILTPIGRIQVIKTMALPILNHLFSSLPDPPHETLTELDELFFNFVWNGKSKISKKILIKEYTEGGLKMIDIRSFIISLKCTWIRRMVTGNGSWINIARTILDVNKLYNCGSHYPENMSNRIHNDFWKDILNCFSSLCKLETTNSKNILYQPIFYNPDITIGGKSFYFKSWFDMGIHFVGDLLNNKDSLIFYSYEDFCKCYNFCPNYLYFLGVVSAIKKLIIKVETPDTGYTKPFIPFCLKSILTNTKGTKPMYATLKKNEYEPVCLTKWSNTFANLTCEDQKHLYNMPFAITQDSTLQWLQYRIVHRILGTNSFLHKIKYIDSPACTFCQNECETIEHIFWECKYVNSFLKDLLSKCTFQEDYLTMPSFILGLHNTNNAINLIFLFIKAFIYNCKMKKNIPTISAVKSYLLFHYNILNKLRFFEKSPNGDECEILLSFIVT
jgi:hypothetical protein